jgi:WD40-like Beta Propeller Repeat
MRRWIALTAATVAAGMFAAPAGATFPGENGPILFREIDTQTGLGQPLFSAQPDGNGVTAINGRSGFFTDWRADGERIAFDFYRPNGAVHIATMDADGSDLEVITDGRAIHELPSWSPSGQRIVFDHSRKDPNEPGFSTELRVMKADGSNERRLPMSSRGFDVEPKYSPDGRWIAFMRLRITAQSFRQAVFVVKTEGRHPVRRLTSWSASAEHPTWSPDSEWIVYNTAPNGTIKAMRADGSDRHTIVEESEGFGAHKPWFSPDGTKLVFMCENWGSLAQEPEDYNEDICTSNANGSNIVHIVDTPETLENWPSWGPAP